MTRTTSPLTTRPRTPWAARRLAALLATSALVLGACASTTADDGAVADDSAMTDDGAGVTAPDDATSPTTEPQEPDEDTSSTDEPGPLAFTAATVAGGEIDVESFAGEPVVLWFWAPWCTICRTEAPEVSTVANELAGDVTFLGVAGQGEADAMSQFVDDTGADGFEHLADLDGSIWGRFGVVSQPTFAFVTADGDVEVVSGALGAEALGERAAALVDG